MSVTVVTFAAETIGSDYEKNVRLLSRKIVYVIGAGFSAGLGYPQTRRLLIDVWPRLDSVSRRKLTEIIAFHHPEFNEGRGTKFPNIEQLLTEIQVNLDLFDASRPAEGNFKKADLEDTRETLLAQIGRWFHELYQRAHKTKWLNAGDHWYMVSVSHVKGLESVSQEQMDEPA